MSPKSVLDRLPFVRELQHEPNSDFEALLRVSPYPYLLIDRRLIIVGANSAFLKSTGRVEADLLGRYVFDAFPENPDDPSSTNVAEVRAIATGEPDTTAFLRYSVPRQTARGVVFDERFWSTVHTPVRGADSEVAFVAQNAIDVSDLYSFDRHTNTASLGPALQSGSRAEGFSRAQMHEVMTRILSDERGQLRNLFNQAPGFIAVLTGENHMFEIVSEAYYLLVGHRQIIGKPLLQALPKMRGQGLVELLDEVRRSGKPFVGRGLKAQLPRTAGAPVTEAYGDLLYQPIFAKNGSVSGIFAQGHDVSEGHAAQLAQAESAKRLANGTVAARMVVWDYDIATRAVVFASNAEQVLGTSDRDIDKVTACVPADDVARVVEARNRAIAERSGYQVIMRFVRPVDGRTIWIDTRPTAATSRRQHQRRIRGVVHYQQRCCSNRPATTCRVPPPPGQTGQHRRTDRAAARPRRPLRTSAELDSVELSLVSAIMRFVA